MELVTLTDYIPDLLVDMRYAGSNNISEKPISNISMPKLDKMAAMALVKVADGLQAQGLRLLVWDAYRSPETQKVLLAVMPNRHYVSRKSLHCRGLAVDITLVDKLGNPLDMGTDHDDFSERAHIDFVDLTPQQLENRHALAIAMTHLGHFKQWPYEWWHFDFVG